MATIGSTNTTLPDTSKYQTGWGIGYGSGNLGNGFNNFTDSNAVQQELNRMNTVTSNRTKFGLENGAEYDSYIGRLNSAIAPIQQANQNAQNAQNAYNTKAATNTTNYQAQLDQYKQQMDASKNNYQNSQAKSDLSNIQNATISDIAKKYGFDFSRDYAKTQAEAEAQALRNANADATRKNTSSNQLNTSKIDSNLMNMSEGLDRNYFQQYMGQAQNQVNSGLNAGIAADQDLRLQMNRQAEMGSAYRDANLGKMEEQQRFSNEELRLAEAMGLIDQQALAREDSLYNERLKDGYGMLNQDRNYYAGQDQQEWGRSQTEIDRALQQQQLAAQNYQWQQAFDYGGMRDQVGDSQWEKNYFQNQIEQTNANNQWNKQFDYTAGRDQVADNQWNKQFDYTAGRDQVADSQWSQQFNWGKLMDEAGLTGNYNGQRTLDGQQFDWGKVVDTAGLTGMFNGQTTWDRNLAQQQLDLQKAELAAANAARAAASRASSSSKAATTSSYNAQMATRNSYNNGVNGPQATPKATTSSLLQGYNNAKTNSIVQNPVSKLADPFFLTNIFKK